MVATVTSLSSASTTVHYFEHDGPYAKGAPEHRKASFWHEEAARALELGRHVSPKRINAILQGYVPETNLRLGRMRDGEHQHRPGRETVPSCFRPSGTRPVPGRAIPGSGIRCGGKRASRMCASTTFAIP